jgi:hypothetical protein
MKNTYEVGCTPDDNNDRRLPGSVNPEPMMGAGAYNFAKPTPLDAADTAGVVGQPYINNGFGMEDSMAPSLNANVDTRNSDTSLMAPVGDSEMNLSAKYKYPNVSQDIPAKGNPKTQYSDHT